jgi:hypothetical protein
MTGTSRCSLAQAAECRTRGRRRLKCTTGAGGAGSIVVGVVFPPGCIFHRDAEAV